MRRSGTPGIRRFNGRHYMLAGRGDLEHCRREAIEHRKRWKYVRIVNMLYRVNNYGIYVFEEIR